MRLGWALPGLKIVTPSRLTNSSVSQPQSPSQSLSPKPSQMLVFGKQRMYPLSLNHKPEAFEQVESLRRSLNETVIGPARRAHRRLEVSVDIPKTVAMPDSPVKLPELHLRDFSQERTADVSVGTERMSRRKFRCSPKTRVTVKPPELRKAKKKPEDTGDIDYHYRAVTFGDKLLRIRRIAERALQELQGLRPDIRP